MNADTIDKRCNLPYAVEYAKSGRSSCKLCKSSIGQSVVRISAREPSTFFDGIQDNWFHFACFWKKIKPGKDQINESSIRGVDWLKWEDQEMLRNRIKKFNDPDEEANVSLTSGGYSNKEYLNLINVKLEPSASNRGKCSMCKNCFQTGEIKIHYKSKFSHPACFFKTFTRIMGTLDQCISYEEIGTDEKQPLINAYNERMKELLNEKRKEQKEEAEKSVKVEKVEKISVKNEEIIVIGTPSPGSSNSGELKRQSSDEIVILDDEEEMKETIETIKKRKVEKDSKAEKMKARKREKLMNQANLMWALRQLFEGLTENEKRLILNANKLEAPSGTEKLIELLCDSALYGVPAPCPECSNGKIFYTSSFKTYMCSGYATEYSKCTYENKNPIRTPFVVPYGLSNHPALASAPFNQLVDRLYPEEEDQVVQQGETSSFKYLGARRLNIGQSVADEALESDQPITNAPVVGQKRQIIKRGTVVDADFQFAEDCHVYKTEQGGLYSATMTFIDVTCNKNSYYKIQLLRHDRDELKFYLFRSWGRTGTTIGGNKTEIMYDEIQAVESFESIFKEKTNNPWKYRKFFKKFPGFFSFVETDYSEFAELEDEVIRPGSKTKLPQPVKQIIMSIFNVEEMKQAMKSFEMDANKLPLGKLSKTQITSAYAVLTELQNNLKEYKVNNAKILDLTNKFYTIIPHNFGMKAPEPIDSFGKIKEKSHMLDLLLDIQLAYDQVKTDNASRMMTNEDPVDSNYRKLNCRMEPLEERSEEYKYISEYMKNTHGTSHEMIYDLLDIIKLDRADENSNFVGNKMGNRKLLWHGSGKMNYAGILGQGLRIAPPEAPVSGYMFGKGVYFADMFTKSCFYCRADNGDEAYLLLCDVALGRIKELYQATTESKSSLKGKYDSVKGIGGQCPNPEQDMTLPDGMVIPKGKAMTNVNANTAKGQLALRYNEYIVYDTNQIQLKYLVRIRVKKAQHKF